MKTRLICILLALTLAAFGFSACGKTASTADPTAMNTEEDGQNPIMNFVGNYQSDRRTMLVEAQGADEARVTVRWGSDAWTHAEWTMSGKVAEEGDGLVMRYADGAYATVTTDESGKETRADETTGGTGTIRFNNDGAVVWTDDQDERIRDVVFEWLPVSSQEESGEALLVGTWSGGGVRYVFAADGSGTLTREEKGIDTAFRYEADPENGSIVFRVDTADDDTSASFVLTDYAHMTLTYDDGRTEELSRIG